MNKDAKNHCEERRNRIEHWHIISAFLFLYDVIICNGSYLLALWLRYDCRFSLIDKAYLSAWMKFAPIYALIVIVVFWRLHLYQSIWRFASYGEFARTVMASAITGILHATLITLLYNRMPLSYYFFGLIIQFIFTIAVRFSYRFVLLEKEKLKKLNEDPTINKVMIIGAGAAGRMLLNDVMLSRKISDKVVCFIDDNSNKWGRYIDGVPVAGGREDILASVEKYGVNKIYITMPSASPLAIRDILDICKETNCELKNLPGVYQFVTGKLTASALKKVEIEDLLGRDPIKVNMDEIFTFLEGKTILITGGGGSIGSEIARQVAKHNPKQLIIFDIYENNAHAIQLELKSKYPYLNLEVLIGSVRDSRRLDLLFRKYRPEIVFHAAAHKHVPLMEDSPCEAIKNNAIGTYKTAYAAMMHGCKRFVLISTDKAVNPTNIMGASKRLCEMVIQTFDKMIKEGRAFDMPKLHVHGEDNQSSMDEMSKNTEYPTTEFVAVRFGNVLGSNGSVIPIFKDQIAKGGPVTVTHPDIIRYFMTIPEATSLVLQAGTYAKGGEIFVLDMGQPVKIDTLARNLIKLSGLKPGIDIEIKYTGLRPGEKLYEEKLMSEEGLRKTDNDLIHIGSPIPFDSDEFLKQLQELLVAAYDEIDDDIKEIVKRTVVTYKPMD